MEKIFIFIVLCASVIIGVIAQGCGETNILPNQRVVGGYETERKAWPWVVSLNFGGPIGGSTGSVMGHKCGGSLVSLEWVLTAAHCLDTPGNPNVFPAKAPSEWRVTAGMHTRSEDEKKEGNWQTSKVKRFVYHADFQDLSTHASNDIALIQLEKPFTYTEYVRPICMPAKRNVQPGWNRCYTAGWGTEGENSTQYALSLREVSIRVVNTWWCLKAHPKQFSERKQICGGDWYKGNMDACKGDSGGPLACQTENGWYVAGIVSWGKGCGRLLKPGVYTNVAAYEEWIYRVMLNYNRQESTASPKSQQDQKPTLQNTQAENGGTSGTP